MDIEAEKWTLKVDIGAEKWTFRKASHEKGTEKSCDFFGVAVCMILTMGIKIAMDGCWLVFLPLDDKVASVTVAYPSLSPEEKELSDIEDVQRCIKMLNLLKYDVLQKSQDTTEPLVTYTYHLKDGTDMVVAANNNTVFYKGKQHVLKESAIFVNVTEGLFFLEETARQP